MTEDELAVPACRIVTVDGVPVRVMGIGDLTPQDVAALTELVQLLRDRGEHRRDC